MNDRRAELYRVIDEALTELRALDEADIRMSADVRTSGERTYLRPADSRESAEPDERSSADVEFMDAARLSRYRLKGARPASIRRAAVEGRLGQSYQDEATGRVYVDVEAAERWWSCVRARRSES